jgi:cytochrome c oxidase subunit 2
VRKAVLGSVALAIGLASGAQEPPSRKITLEARQFEWTPALVEVKVGEAVELTLESADEEHGFECLKLGLRKIEFRKGEPARVTFKAERAGTYFFKCAHYCGRGHSRMRGKIVVTE